MRIISLDQLRRAAAGRDLAGTDARALSRQAADLESWCAAAQLDGLEAAEQACLDPLQSRCRHRVLSRCMIESWGRGIERLLEACQEAHTPAPELRYEHTALWVEFRFRPEHIVAATTRITWEVAGEVTGEERRPGQTR